MTKHELLNYEIAASEWWASWIGWPWLQNLVAEYFVWKVQRKHAAWMRSQRRAPIFMLKSDHSENTEFTRSIR